MSKVGEIKTLQEIKSDLHVELRNIFNQQYFLSYVGEHHPIHLSSRLCEGHGIDAIRDRTLHPM